MDWVWEIYEDHIMRRLGRDGGAEPTDERVRELFLEVLSDSTVTVLVQEPWRGSVRFKCLDRRRVADWLELIRQPEAVLKERWGGGKYKLNFHQGWQFIATRNFKPDGEPLWQDVPEFELTSQTVAL